jgi:hypothetical protein
LGAFLALRAKNRAFRFNLLAAAKRISAAIPCAWQLENQFPELPRQFQGS